MFSTKRPRYNTVGDENNFNEAELKAKAEAEKEDESSEEELGHQQLSSLKSRMKAALKTNFLDISVTRLKNENFKNEVIPFLERNPEVIRLDASLEFVISHEVCQYLSKNTSVKYFAMRLSEITSTMAQTLKKNRSIISLDISGNNIDDDGAIGLALNKNIKELYIFNNKITKVGAEALIKNMSLTSLGIDADIINDDNVIKGLIENNTLMFLSVNTKDQTLIKRLEEISKERVLSYGRTFATFLMGEVEKVGKGSPILHSFRRNILYDKKLLREISDFLKPPATLKIT